MTPEELEDDTARPLAPLVELSPEQQWTGRRLARVHDMYRQELSQLYGVMEAIRGRETAPQELVNALNEMTFVQNLALFGNLCGRECSVLQNHHDIEEQWMFPAIAQQGDDQWKAVIARLHAEHRVIQELIEDLYQVAGELAENPTEELFEDAAYRFARLDRGVRAHFGYEEDQLQGALATMDIPV